MDTKSLAAKATALAASIPPHLGKPTTPPISWAQVGDQVIVILADGRKVSASIEKINELMFSHILPVLEKSNVNHLKELDLSQTFMPPAKPSTKSTAPSKKAAKK